MNKNRLTNYYFLKKENKINQKMAKIKKPRNKIFQIIKLNSQQTSFQINRKRQMKFLNFFKFSKAKI